MPTTLARIQVTETPTVRHALALAARRWPDAPKSEQLTRLIEIGSHAIDDEDRARLARRRAAVERYAGIFGSDVYPPNYLADLRAEDRE